MKKQTLGWLAIAVIVLSGLSVLLPSTRADSTPVVLDGESHWIPTCPSVNLTFTCLGFGLSTTKLNDTVIMALTLWGTSVIKIIDSAGLNWTLRMEGMTGGNGWCFPSCTSFEMNAEYYAIAPTVLSNDNTTVVFRSYQGAPALLDGFEFALTGVDANSPFDPSPGLPAIGQCPNYPNDNQSCSVNIQTSQANDFVFVIVSLGNSTCTTNGFTNILAHSHLEVDYLDPAGPGSATFTCLDGSYPQPAVIIGDAVADPPSTTPSTGTVTSGGGGRGPLRI